MKKNWMLICLILVFAILVTACRNNHIESSTAELSDKLWFGGLFGFHFQLYIDDEPTIVHYLTAGRRLIPGHQYHDPLLTELVFVHNEDEAVGFPRNVVVAWPQPGTLMQQRVDYINWAILEDINPHRRRPEGTDPTPLGIEGLKEIYGLTYPITLADFVYNWEILEELIFSFRSATIGMIAR